MFEEDAMKVWRCPQCGIVNKVRVEETTKRIFERILKGGIFEVYSVKVRMKVFCFECNSECYRED